MDLVVVAENSVVGVKLASSFQKEVSKITLAKKQKKNSKLIPL